MKAKYMLNRTGVDAVISGCRFFLFSHTRFAKEIACVVCNSMNVVD